MLSFPVVEKLINTSEYSPINYCNALLAGVSKATLNELQVMRTLAARILTRTRITDHITPILKSSHYLPVRVRVDFKILMIPHKVLHGLVSQYLSKLLTR